MAYIPDDFIDQLRHRSDLADVVGSFIQVKRRGSDHWACCPFHKEKTPSFKIDSQRQTFYCFGCKKSGNLFHFVQEMLNTDFVGAIHWLADRHGLPVPEVGRDGDSGAQGQRRQWREQGLALLQDAAAWYQHLLKQPEAEKARAYVRSRNLDEATVEHFGLGYCLDSWDALCRWAASRGYDNNLLQATGMVSQKEGASNFYDRFRDRLIFPIHDELNRVVGFSARVLDSNAQTAKYVNSPESDFFQKNSILYGLNHARRHLRAFGHALICEGQLDVIACHRAGLTQAVAAQGTAFTENHARLLKRSTNNVVLAFDADTAGNQAAQRTIAILHEVGIAVSVVSLPAGEDPDSIFQHGGPEALAQIMGAGEPAIPWMFRQSCQAHDLRQPEDKSIIVNEVLQTILPISDQVVRTAHCQWLAGQLQMPENILFDVMHSLLAARQQRRPSPFVSMAGQTDPRQTNVSQATAMPIFAMPQENEKTWQLMLELILCHQQLACNLADDDNVARLLPDNPLGMAISRVLALVDQDCWEDAPEILCNSELIRDPLVGAVINSQSFQAETICRHLQNYNPVNSEQETREMADEKICQAYQDCRKILLTTELQQKITEKTEALANASGEESTKLMRELMELNKQKRELG